MEAVKGKTANCLWRKTPKIKLSFAALDTSCAPFQVLLGNGYLQKGYGGLWCYLQVSSVAPEQSRAANSK